MALRNKYIKQNKFKLVTAYTLIRNETISVFSDLIIVFIHIIEVAIITAILKVFLKMKTVERIKNTLRNKIYNYYLLTRRKQLKNKDFSLIASNCNGGYILHDLNLPFNSPFVNLWIRPKDFIKMLSDFKNYMNKELSFTKEEGINYPVGLLGGEIKIYFMHYENEDDAKDKWERRKVRINYENLFILFTDRDGCEYQDIVDYDNLPFSNKIIFTHKPYKQIQSAFYIKGFENCDSVGFCSEWMPTRFKKRYYDQFNYVKWFNNKR